MDGAYLAEPWRAWKGTNTKGDEFRGATLFAKGRRRRTTAWRAFRKEAIQMIRLLVGLGVVLLLTNSSLAQSYCQQVRQAVATYGYAAAKRHAMAHYGRKAVRAGDRCLTKGHLTRRHLARR